MTFLYTTAILFALCNVSLALYGIGRTQSVAVSGRLTCNGQPAQDVEMNLYQKELFLEATLQNGTSDSNGQFWLSGSITETSNISPKLNIYHKCNYGGMCYRRITIEVPKSYVSLGTTPEQTYDVGTINLGNYSGQKTDCLAPFQ